MSSLYLLEQGAVVRQESERLVIYRDGARVADVPLLKLERVVVFGHVHLTTGAISALLRHGVDTTFLSWHGRLKGRLVALESKNIPLRVAQYERARDEAFASEVARRIVRAKVQSALRVIARYHRNHPEWSAPEETQERVLDGHPTRSRDRDVLWDARTRSRPFAVWKGRRRLCISRRTDACSAARCGFRNVPGVRPRILSTPRSHSGIRSCSARP
jgi:CRISPR/Cas system-associated endonuclease Cas1